MSQAEKMKEAKRQGTKEELADIKKCITDAGNVRRALEYSEVSHSVYKKLIEGKAVKIASIDKLIEFCTNLKNS